MGSSTESGRTLNYAIKLHFKLVHLASFQHFSPMQLRQVILSYFKVSEFLLFALFYLLSFNPREYRTVDYRLSHGRGCDPSISDKGGDSHFNNIHENKFTVIIIRSLLISYHIVRKQYRVKYLYTTKFDNTGSIISFQVRTVCKTQLS